MIKTDILIIGAGPTGLFTVFEAGLLKMKCHILDSLTQPGGQCIELYPKQPIYDIPGYPEIIAGDLIENLLEQIKPFQPSYTLGETALNLDKLDDGSFKVTTDKGTEILAKIIAIAGGMISVYILYFKKITVARPPDGSCNNTHDNKTITDINISISKVFIIYIFILFLLEYSYFIINNS